MTWTRAELAFFRRLSTPERIQAFLDGLTYRAETEPASPRGVIEERRAHCYDGALFAAAALRRLGHAPRLVDLRAVNDDDHVLAVFQVRGAWGAIAKSNFAGLRYREPIHRTLRELDGLRYREPIHRTLRELALTYFEDYFNTDGEKTLREFSSPLSLRQFDRLGWEFRAEPLPGIADRLDALRHFRLLTPAQARGLAAVDARSLEAGMVGTLAEGVYKGG